MNLPFVGSEISLISNSDIRFVGILHSINLQDSSVSLENVKSFGTEDRRIYDKIPGSDQIFSFIKFKGSDIKDLYVISSPPQPIHPGQPMVPMVQQGLPPGMDPYYAQQAMAFHQQQQEQYWMVNQGSAFQNSTTEDAQRHNVQDSVQKAAKKTLKEEKREINVVLSRGNQVDGKNTVSFDLPEKPKETGKKQKFKIPESEFDFATANAKFEKSLKEQDTTVYYQKSSFFDNISSEVKDRTSASTDRKQRMNQEKSQNLETFGTTGMRRGRGRSYRGRKQNTSHGS